MIGSLGLVISSGLMPLALEPASIRIDLVAEVPVTCSMGSVVGLERTSSGLRAALAGTCNTDHVVRVVFVDGGTSTLSAQLNGHAGTREPGSLSFQRPAYFSNLSVLDVEIGDGEAGAFDGNGQIRVEISPV